jgi:peptidoglycan/xylan/chitin deacetylase (PgdA/CDA1 family)
VLVRHAVPVTLYAATAFIDEGAPFPGDAAPMSWAQLRDACSTGLVDVGSHTHGHRLLDRLPVIELDAELDRSIALIGEHLGRVPRDFAYPKAVLGSPAAELAVRARFRSAALAGTRANRYEVADPYRLARSPIQRSDGQRWFVRKATGGMAFEDRLRGWSNRRRYAAATT